jgi:hypothetical protein
VRSALLLEEETDHLKHARTTGKAPLVQTKKRQSLKLGA